MIYTRHANADADSLALKVSEIHRAMNFHSWAFHGSIDDNRSRPLCRQSEWGVCSPSLLGPAARGLFARHGNVNGGQIRDLLRFIGGW